MVSDLWYISGNQVINNNQDLILTSTNGNIWWEKIVNVTWLQFIYNESGSYIAGIPYVSSEWNSMDDYVATNFTFSILATNIYGITWEIKYTINISPSCTESEWCTDPVYVFWWTTLAEAQAQRDAAMLSGTNYLNDKHWYPHWFSEIKQTWPNFYFTGVVWDSSAITLYCASTWDQLLINYWWYSGPQWDVLSVPSQTFTGNNLVVSGTNAFLFDVFTASINASYITEEENGNQKMTIYVNRPLTGKIFYSVCEFTGNVLDVFNCPIPWNYTWDVNWTKLATNDEFIVTWWIEWWWITGNWNGFITWWSVADWEHSDFLDNNSISNGWWTRKYSKIITWNSDQDINTSGSVSFDITNRTWLNKKINYEVYWIDNTNPDVTGYVSVIQPNQSATLTLSGYNTWVLATSFTNNLIWDDEYIITKFSWSIEPNIFENWYGSNIHTGQFYIDGLWSEYKMIHNITFAQDREWQICVKDRAGNERCTYVVIAGIGSHKDLVITVKQAFRPDPSESVTGYAIVDWDFWFWVKSGTEWTQNYNSAKNTNINPKITTSMHGTGIVSIMTPANGSEYLVVFKWSGTLSAGFTGIWSDAITELNFFSWAYANNFSDDFVYKYDNGTYREHYLKVWDVSVNGIWDYDYVITADFSLINNNLTIWLFNSPIRYDFDLNNVISAMEQSMTLQAWNAHWFIWWLDYSNIIPMTGFVEF